MEGLKTLKDLETQTNYWDEETQEFNKLLVDSRKLKQEAIKWIKFGTHGCDEWIKHFFNLTEEDLK
jgi:hypothetical protein